MCIPAVPRIYVYIEQNGALFSVHLARGCINPRTRVKQVSHIIIINNNHQNLCKSVFLENFSYLNFVTERVISLPSILLQTNQNIRSLQHSPGLSCHGDFFFGCFFWSNSFYVSNSCQLFSTLHRCRRCGNHFHCGLLGASVGFLPIVDPHTQEASENSH